ncbi:hypothetical protein CPB83DRAFT_769816, partial [Crepidotus variabilis]
GVGMQNFTYTAAWEEFCHLTCVHSPKAYESLREYFPAPSQRNLRKKEARQPPFPMTICSCSFYLAEKHLKALDYTGPVGLSTDDTKLFAMFQLYYNLEKKAHYLIGATDGPILVANPENVREAIEEAQHRKAEKVNNLFALKTANTNKDSLGLVAPIIVAALPISDSMDAPALLDLHIKVLNGLIDRGIQVVSYACNGTEVERAVQRMFLDKTSKCKYRIKDPRDGGKDLVIVYGIY